MLQPRLYPAVLLSALLAMAQTPAIQSSPKSELTLHTGVQEVLLDLVIRDKNQKLVRNLKPEEIQILVDGVPQPVKSFRVITGHQELDAPLERAQTAPQATEKGATTSLQSPAEPNLVAIVFARLGGDSRTWARRAVGYFLESRLPPNTYVALFNLDQQLELLSGFTDSRQRLMAAVNHASPDGRKDLATEARGIFSQTDEQRLATAAEAGGGPPLGSSPGERIVAQMLGENMLDYNYQTGMRTLLRVLTMIRELGRLPGRKTVIYAANGLVTPSENAELLDTLISEANRLNVSIYGLDMARMASHPLSSPRMEGIDLNMRQPGVGEAVTPAHAKRDDAVAYILKGANASAPLERLSGATGGSYIFNGADLGEGMERIMEDVREHYEVTFAPTSMNFDGKFRKIDVILARKGLQVQGRSGYYDLPSIPGQTVLPYELAALNALSAKQLPRDFPFHVESLRYRPVASGTLCVLAVEIPLSALQPHANEDGVSTQLHGAFLALVKDASGQVVSKVSRELRYTLANERVDAVSKGVVTVTQLFDVPAGRYTVETAVSDAIGGQASTKRNVFVVEPHSELALSDIAVARRVEALTEERNLHDPLEFAGGKVTPSPGDSVDAGAPTSLYFQIYPNAASSEKPELTLSFYVDGQPVARQKPELPQPDPDGTIPFLATARMNPGTYMVRATVKQGSLVKSEESTITVQ